MNELAGRVRVVLAVIDAMPHRCVGPDLTPNLWRQVTEGGRAPDGGRSVPVSVTYANHAALVTGVAPEITGLHGNHAWDDVRGWVPGPAEGPRATTAFDRVADAGGRSVAVVGDHKLVPQMGAARADHVWPPDGRFPAGTPRCAFRYATDDAVVAAAAEADLDADFVLLHLNEPDTTSHLHGPDSPEAIEQYRSTDAAYGQLVELLADGWDRTVAITVSDHDQETIVADEPHVDLAAALADHPVAVAHEGTAALIHGAVDDEVRAAVLSVPGVEGAEQLAPDVWMAWTEPGRMFPAAIPLRGQHGSPRCREQVAIVSGGHPFAASLAGRVRRTRPSVLDWAPAIVDSLGIGARLG